MLGDQAGPLRPIQNVGDKGLLTRGISDTHYSQVRGALGDWSQQLLDQIHPRAGDAASTGSWLKGQLESALDKVHDDAAQDFAAIDQQTKGVAVDTQPVRDWAAAKLKETDPARVAMQSLDPKKATSILLDLSTVGNIEGTPKMMDFSTAQQIRSRLWKVGNIPSDVIPGAGSGLGPGSYGEARPVDDGRRARGRAERGRRVSRGQRQVEGRA